jgi:transcriptional regulator with XRE-family HTH domain
MAKRAKQTLGNFLRTARNKAELSLRDVEEKTKVSNAYISQVESEKIKQPSPVVLHKLSNLYGVAYSALMSLAGYPVPQALADESVLHARVGPLTEEEEDAVVDYIEFLRSKRKTRGHR